MKNYYFLGSLLLAGAAIAPAYAQDAPAPIDELVMGSNPCMSDEGPIDLEEAPYGMSGVMLNCMVTLEKNLDCAESIMLYYLADDEPTVWGSISATDGQDNDYQMAPYCYVESYGMGDELDPSSDIPCDIMLLFDDTMPITLSGFYSIEIPDGFFKYNGEEVPGGMFLYEIAGDGPVAGPESFAETIFYSMPEMNKANSIEMADAGVAGMFFMMNPEAGVMSINKKCPYSIQLLKANGELISEISATAEYDEESLEFKPAYMFTSVAYDESMTETNMSLLFLEDTQYEPGTYILSVPDDFFMIGEGEDAYPLYGSKFMIVLADENNQVGSFDSFVYSLSPMTDTEINVETDPYYMFFGGIDGLDFQLNTTMDFVTNSESAPAKITKDDVEFADILPVKYSDTNPYVSAYGFSYMNDGQDSEFGGYDEDPEFTTDPVEAPIVNNWTVRIVLLNDTFFKDPGTYKVTIPTGFFRLGEFDVTESSFSYIVTNNAVAVEMFKSEKAVTVFNVNGVRVLDNAPVEALRNLEKGIYVVNGKKVVMN